MKRTILAILIVATFFAGRAYSQQLVAEQVTKDNAAQRLFTGSDANGGIGDWYISNGVVEAIIDNAAFQPDLAAKGTNRPIQNIVAPTGGTLIDLGLVGKGNDQFNQMFQVSNIDPNNAFFFTSITANVTPQLATVTAQGIVLFTGVSSLPGTGGPGPTLTGRTVYSLAPGDNFITVTSTVINNNQNDVPVFNITDAIPLIGRAGAPFAPFPGRGFNNPQLNVTTPQGIAQALGMFPFFSLPGNIRPENGVMDPASLAACGEVSYTLQPISIAVDPDGDGPMPPVVTPLAAFIGITSGLVSAAGNPFDPTMSPMLPAGAALIYTRRVYVGNHIDVNSSATMAYQNLYAPTELGTLTGDVDAADNPDVEASIIFEGQLTKFFDTQTVPVTQVLTDKTGKFSVTLPAGDYMLTISSPERDDMTNVKVTVVAGKTTTATLPPLNAVGTVNFTVSEKGAPVPAKLTFIGLNGTPNPDFARFFSAFITDPMTAAPLIDYQVSTYTSAPALNFVFTTDGAGSQIIKPGQYQVIASRGLEYTIDMQTITVTAGQPAKVDFNIERVVDTTGYVSSDFHVHTGRSNDSSLPLEDRIRSYVAENVEVLVSTDHNFITDFAPIVNKLGLGKFVKTIIGDELTTSLPTPIFPQAFGHHIAYPLLEQPQMPRNGAPYTEYVPAATFYDRARAMNPNVQEVIQLNHPRSGVAGLTLIGLLNILKFNPTQPPPLLLTTTSQLSSTRNIDFDAMELYNGNSVGEYQQVRNDWFSLLDQGFTKTATAVSDSHRAVVETPGFPCSYVATPTDDPSMVTDSMITTSVLAHNVVGTSGPFIRFDINGKPMGSLITKKTGKVTLNISVSAPAWVPVDEVRVLANGNVIMTFDANSKIPVTPAPADPTSDQGVERFKASIKVTPKKDTYYTVEAGIKLPDALDLNGDGVIDTGDTNGDGTIDSKDNGLVQPPSPPIYAAIAPGFTPIAFTNPIFIDRNGNGKFDPPGLKVLVVPTVANPITLPVKPNNVSNDDYFPWYKFHVGAEEMHKFFQLLNGRALKLAQPRQQEEINEKLNNHRFNINALRDFGIWAYNTQRRNY